MVTIQDRNQILDNISNNPKSVFVWALCGKDKKGELTIASNFLTCKDHLCDVIRTEFQDKHSLPYLSHNRVAVSLVKDQTYLLIKLPDWAQNDTDSVLTRLNKWEKSHKLQRTTVEETNFKDVYLFTGSKMWMRSILAFSAYASMIRMFFHWPTTETILDMWNVKATYHCNEIAYRHPPAKIVWKHFLSTPRLFLKKPEHGIDGYETKNNLHGYGGIFFMSTMLNQQEQPLRKQNPMFNKILTYIEENE